MQDFQDDPVTIRRLLRVTIERDAALKSRNRWRLIAWAALFCLTVVCLVDAIARYVP